MKRLKHGEFWVGLAIGASTAALAFEVRYINWHPIVAPVDSQPLRFRQDAKGDGRFGSPRSGNRRHRGVDLVAKLNSPVRAIRSGTVVEVGSHRGLGRFIEIEHRHALRSLYAHLNEVTVEPGKRVEQGAVIGAVGKTGNANHRWIMPHLHLEVLRSGEPIDPQQLGLDIVDPEAEEASKGEDAASSDARDDGG
jgi:murein DD-endopeptidase MepM/ murein hydrolase activator NlpD